MSDIRRERLRREEPRSTPPPTSPAGNAAMVGKVVSAPSAIGKFFPVNPVAVTGAETVGGPGSFAVGSDQVQVYALGPGLPAVNDYLVCRFVDFRWVAEKGQPAAPANPCHCTWPRVLTYRGSVTQCAASFYFLNFPAASPEPSSYTLTWQSRPAEVPFTLQLLYYNYPGGVHDPYYIDMPAEAWFSAPIPGYIFGAPTHFYFYLWMQACQANVMVIDSPYGAGSGASAARGAGNGVITYIQRTCTPFAMTSDFTPGRPNDLTGTHGDDDIVPGANGGAGIYTNNRVGF